MPYPFLAVMALYSVHLGFSALLGYWIKTARERSALRLQALPMLAYATLLVSANWIAPMNPVARIILALLSALAIWLLGFRFDALNIHPDWFWFYAAFSMATILLWSILQQQALLAIAMSIMAFAACILALQRGNRSFIAD